MKISFINYGTLSPPDIAITYLMTVLKNNGYQVRLLDLNRKYHLKDKFNAVIHYGGEKRAKLSENYLTAVTGHIENISPDIVCFSAYSYNYRLYLKLADYIKSISPGTGIVFGGHLATVIPETIISKEQVDAVCVGEGEITFIESLPELRPVNGMWVKQKGRVIKTGNRVPAVNPDVFSFPDWSFWGMEKYRAFLPLPGAVSIMPSRGCMLECGFCGQSALPIPHGKYRERSAENIISELKYIVSRHGAESVFIESDNFDLFNVEKISKIAQFWESAPEMKDIVSAVKISGSPYAENFIRLLKRMNCCLVTVQAVTHNENIRAAYSKKNKNNDLKYLFKEFHDNGIMTRLNMITGFENETFTDIIKSYRFARDIGIENPYVRNVRIYPGTKVKKERRLFCAFNSFYRLYSYLFYVLRKKFRKNLKL